MESSVSEEREATAREVLTRLDVEILRTLPSAALAFAGSVDNDDDVD